MAMRFSSGTDFNLGDTANAAALNAILTSATQVAGADRTNMNRDVAQVVTLQSSDQPPPGLATLEPWMSNITRWQVCQLADGTPKSAQPYAVTVTYEAAASGDLLAGQSCAIQLKDGADITIEKTKVGEPYKAMGVNAYQISPGEQGVMILHGMTRVRFDGTETPTNGRAFESSANKRGFFVESLLGHGPLSMGTIIGGADTIDGDEVAWVALRR